MLRCAADTRWIPRRIRWPYHQTPPSTPHARTVLTSNKAMKPMIRTGERIPMEHYKEEKAKKV
jgi:hypothetical protein